jgi:phosphatidylserine/phosphatidylglycerophosphate/cardiolipin synthase-like enzyme
MQFLISKHPRIFASLIIMSLSGCGLAMQSQTKSHVSPLIQDSAIQVYFNHNLSAKYDDPYRHFSRLGDNLEQIMINQINQAKSSIDIAVLEFRLPKLAASLIKQHQQGIKVRIIIDNDYLKTLSDYSPDEINKMNPYAKSRYEQLKLYPQEAIAMLKNSGIEIKDDRSNNSPKGSGLMHHKFIIVDGKTTIISSGNFTTSDLHGDFNQPETRGNPNNMIVIPNNNQVAQVFTQEFDYMWSGLFKIHKPERDPVTIPVGKGTVTINFSPSRKKQDFDKTSNGMIKFFINQTKTSAYLALFVFSDQQISDSLESIRNRGVNDIKVLIDPDFYKQTFSNSYDILGLCPQGQGNPKIKPWQNPINTVGYPISKKGDRGVHSKMAILDHTLVITGSHNWSDAANYKNDETLIAIENPLVAAHYEQEFNRLYANSVLGKKTLPHASKCQGDGQNNHQQTESEPE